MQIGSVNFENRGTEEVPIWYIPSGQEGTVKVTLSSVAPAVADSPRMSRLVPSSRDDAKGCP